jgi:hypothetical protein
MHCSIDYRQCEHFIAEQLEDYEGDFLFAPGGGFEQEVSFLARVFESVNQYCYPLHQEKLPLDLGQAHIRVAERLGYAIEQGGEGIVLRDPTSRWTPKRHAGILKYKGHLDDEGTIVGFTSGRETNKGSRLLGKIGALIVDYKGKRLELSGLTDEEREFEETQQAGHFAVNNPGKDMPSWVQGKHFKLGQTVSFIYRELTDDGIPKEARYFRQRDVE